MKYILSFPLPEAAQPTERTRLATQLAELGILGGGSSVESISGQAADLSLEGQIRWGPTVSEMLGKELDELSDASVGALPLYGGDGSYDGAGYYEVQRADVEPLHTQRRDAYEYTLSLKYAGTRASKWRAVDVDVSQTDHPWGNDDRALVAAPAAAEGVQWFDRETKQTADASIVATRATEHGDVDVVDARSAPYDSAALVYDLEYGDGVPADVVVWDTRGNSSRTDSDGIRQWQKVLDQEHDPAGDLVLSNGLVRLQFDTATPSLTAERWDAANTTWTSQTLGSSDWEFSGRFSIQALGLAQVRARVEFADPTQSPTAYHTLDCYLARGYTDPLWAETGDPTPSGLVDLLDPIASELIYDPGPVKGLVDRKEVL